MRERCVESIRKIRFKCVNCGVCESVCPTKAVRIVEVGRHGFKPLLNEDICINCGLCLKVCPVQDISTPDDFSKVKKVYRARSKDPNIYMSGASGGGVSSLLICMFDKNEIDAALVVFYDENLNLFGDFITSKDEVLKHSGSFYQPSKQLININNIKRFRSVAIVGLPCHIEAFKKYAMLYKLGNVHVTISLFCTIGRMRKGFLEFIKQKYKMDLESLEFVEYKSRYGKSRYGDIILKTLSGKMLSYKFLEYLEFVDYFYVPEGCLYCRKMFGLNGDISVGDDWGIKTDKKICLISINTDRGRDRFSKCELLECNEVGTAEVLLSSQHKGALLKVYSHPLKVPVLKLIKIMGWLNTMPVIRKLAHLFRSIALLGLVKLIRAKSDSRKGNL